MPEPCRTLEVTKAISLELEGVPVYALLVSLWPPPSPLAERITAPPSPVAEGPLPSPPGPPVGLQIYVASAKGYCNRTSTRAITESARCCAVRRSTPCWIVELLVRPWSNAS